MKYYLFTDETGSWSDKNSDSYYIRGWFLIDQENYDYLKDKFVREAAGVEVKWSNAGKISEDTYQNYFDSLISKTFVTYTKLEEFYNNRYNFRNNIKDYLENILNISQKPYIAKIAKKIVESVNYFYFLETYEKYHFIVGLEKLIKYLEPQDELFLFVDKPQFNERDYNEMAEKLIRSNFSKYRINIHLVKKSEDEPGIQLAGIISGCYEGIMKNKGVNKCQNFYSKYIFPTSSVPPVRKIFKA